MKVEFRRSGGFANIPLTVTLDTASMPPEDARELEAAIHAAKFFELPATVGGGAPARDTYQYIVTVTTPERQRSVAMSDELPPPVKGLVDHLVRAARSARRPAGPAA